MSQGQSNPVGHQMISEKVIRGLKGLVFETRELMFEEGTVEVAEVYDSRDWDYVTILHPANSGEPVVGVVKLFKVAVYRVEGGHKVQVRFRELGSRRGGGRMEFLFPCPLMIAWGQRSVNLSGLPTEKPAQWIEARKRFVKRHPERVWLDMIDVALSAENHSGSAAEVAR
jgi:hypothetical protein